MAENFSKYEFKMKQYLPRLDVNYFIEDLSDLFSKKSLKSLNECEKREKIDLFFTEFNKLKSLDKFERFKNSAKKHNAWINSFLSVDIKDVMECMRLDGKILVMDNLLDLLRKSKEKLCVMDTVFISALYDKEIITRASKDYLLASLDKYGPETTLFDFFAVVSAMNENWYGKVLYILEKQKTAFMELIREDMNIDPNDTITESLCMEYADKVIEKHMQRYKDENLLSASTLAILPDNTDTDNDNTSDYIGCDGAFVNGDDEGDFELPSFEEDYNESEINPVELKLKKFQLELSATALKGGNVIIYAPTGTGKTVVAVHIANKHLLNNPNGKVAFLVHRIPLVTQQFKAFQKFKDPILKIMEMKGRSDTATAPLKTYLKNFNVFVMTSDILHNALIINDGNKLSSICDFSLIFFDECHNCMKLHPYTRIMKEYFKEKFLNKSKNLPQIVGLTASPRSNKKDDFIGMKNSLFELCANMDCSHFSMVKNNLSELQEEMTVPKQEVSISERRSGDEFETGIINLMNKCERKLLKMNKEGYFKKGTIINIPSNKFDEEYIGFVGNLERINTVTKIENDGKQKAYSIYRYLNAYYRGLMVNQMFNEHYARDNIAKYLKHNEEDFTCCYDEKFLRAYKDKLIISEQSYNPSIDEIKFLIQKQFEVKEDSRILIFVQQVNYAFYLVDLLKKVNIDAEAIVSSRSKKLSEKCSINQMNSILERFQKGDIKVLVATTVVEEGLDIGLCNMVISYGHVTNETALIQRQGRARSTDSRYVLVLPPMLACLAKKEALNVRRKNMMMYLIEQFGQIDFKSANFNNFIFQYQGNHFSSDTEVCPSVNNSSWKFRCKTCQEFVCSSEDLRIVDSMHRVSINATLFTKFNVVIKQTKTYGLQKVHEKKGDVMCNCNNKELGSLMVYKNVPFFQVSLIQVNVESSKGDSFSLKRWKEFGNYYSIPDISPKEHQSYSSEVAHLKF